VRRVYFGFHYDNDVSRAMVVRKSEMTKNDVYGFIDAAAIEEFKKGDEAIKRWIGNQLINTSVTAILTGTYTYQRRWVRYEILKSIIKGNGLLNVEIHNIEDMQSQKPSQRGDNPFNYYYFKKQNGKVYIWESTELTSIKWPSQPTFEFNLSEFKYNTSQDKGYFSEFVKTQNYMNDDGYNNLPAWIENAAKQAGRD
jgi:hypothetical protein